MTPLLAPCMNLKFMLILSVFHFILLVQVRKYSMCKSKCNQIITESCPIPRVLGTRDYEILTLSSTLKILKFFIVHSQNRHLQNIIKEDMYKVYKVVRFRRGVNSSVFFCSKSRLFQTF